jgi:SAM-dependent methyltransferase
MRIHFSWVEAGTSAGATSRIVAAIRERSKRRWRSTRPLTDLTWGKKLSGDAFISRVDSYGAFSNDKSILEVGPGYGRLLSACLERPIPFSEYWAVDLSDKNVEWLGQTFDFPNVHFAVGDVEDFRVERRFDVVMSSLTFKHLYPSFERALGNLATLVNPGGKFFFDLREGRGRVFDPRDFVTYVRLYQRSEIQKILSRLGLQLIGFDEVEHDANHRRLLVVAGKEKGSELAP